MHIIVDQLKALFTTGKTLPENKDMPVDSGEKENNNISI